MIAFIEAAVDDRLIEEFEESVNGTMSLLSD